MDTWTITELASRAAAALGDLTVNGRVQDVPNERLIRWYTTIGLVDPPLREGRTARYAPRHLFQLVAVKRRQAQGRSLAEIQLELTGALTPMLAEITGPLPDIVWPPTPVSTGSAVEQPRRFWALQPDPQGEVSADSPVPVTPASPMAAQPFDSGSEEVSASQVGSMSPRRGPESASTLGASTTDQGPVVRVPSSAQGQASSPHMDAGAPPRAAPSSAAERVSRPQRSEDLKVLQGVALAVGVTLLIEGEGLSSEDVAALRAAAAPLLDELARRGVRP